MVDRWVKGGEGWGAGRKRRAGRNFAGCHTPDRGRLRDASCGNSISGVLHYVCNRQGEDIWEELAPKYAPRWVPDAGEFSRELISAIMLLINKPVIEIYQNSTWLTNR